MDGKTKSLEANIAELEAQIKGEQNKASSLENRTSSTTDKETQDQLLNDLHARFEKYTDCKMDASANPTTISMLTDLEGKLESLLSQMDEKWILSILSKPKSRKKRKAGEVRQQRLKEQQEEYEERLRRSMARAAAPVKKRTGKREMKRHTLVKKKTKKKTKDTAAEEAKRNEHVIFS